MNSIRPHRLVCATTWAILAAMLALVAPAQAQTYDPNYPVCLQIYDDMVHYYFECAYTSIPQCQASASGRAAQCIVNPYYAAPQARPGPHKKRTHPH